MDVWPGLHFITIICGCRAHFRINHFVCNLINFNRRETLPKKKNIQIE